MKINRTLLFLVKCLIPHVYNFEIRLSMSIDHTLIS